MLDSLTLPPLPTLYGERVILRGPRDSDVDDRLRLPIDPEEEDLYGSAWRREWDGRRYHTREYLTAGSSSPDPRAYAWKVEYDGHCIGSAALDVNPEQHSGTAVTDKRIRENPCQIKGADKESSPERPVLSVPEVHRLADAIAPRYRALVLLATFGNMRWGELAGLRRRYLDLDGRRVRVVETVYEFGQLVKGTPKSEASKRKITLPELIMPELWRHLDTYSAPGPDGFVFVGVKGGQLRRSNFSKPWAQALAKAGLSEDLHVHDLRHTGNTLAAEAGASLGELMNRMGHSSTRAARIYLQTREEREQQLAATLDRMARRELKASGAKRTARRSGTQRARGPQSGDSQSEAGQDE